PAQQRCTGTVVTSAFGWHQEAGDGSGHGHLRVINFTEEGHVFNKPGDLGDERYENPEEDGTGKDPTNAAFCGGHAAKFRMFFTDQFFPAGQFVNFWAVDQLGEHEPGNEQHDDCPWNADEHPCAEGHVEAVGFHEVPLHQRHWRLADEGCGRTDGHTIGNPE